MARGETLGCISKSKSDIIVSRLKGEFKVPVKLRSKEQIKALNLLRKRKDFSVHEDGRLMCDGKIVIVQEELPSYVERTFKENNGCGSRVLYNKLKERYAGFSERSITEILQQSTYYHKEYPRFTNQPFPRTVKSSASNERWQIDIVNMKGFEVKYQESTYRYILQVIDIYSRYTMPQPLKSKASTEVATALEKVMLDHGFPETIQCDNGSEFQGPAMKSFLQKHNIKVVHGRPYYPQSQGKCERSNRSLKKKIIYACRQESGFNWVRNLQQIAHSLNTSVKRVLGNLTPFQVYNGRSHTRAPKSLSRNEIKRRLTAANKSFRRRQVKGAKKPSMYKKGEKILLRYPFSRQRVPTKRRILNGIVKDAKLSRGRYLIEYVSPKNKNKVQEWVGVENITSLTLEMERQKQQKINKVQKNRKDNHKDNRKDRAQKKLHRAQYYQVLKHADKIQMFDTEFQNGVHVIMNPEPDGNCQFAAIKHQLQQHGIYRDEAQLRGEAVDHLRKNRCFYEQFIHGSSFDDYLTHMSQDGSYGDNLTLMAIMREYNMQCYVVSAAGADHSALVSNDGVYDSNLPLITIGYFPEDKGMHYLSVSVDVDLLRELTEDTVFPTPEPDNFEQDQGETSNIDSLRTKRATLIKERQQKKIKKTRFPFRLLPLLVQEIIVSKILHQNPSMRYVLEKVDGYFVELIRNMNVPRPKIYVSPALIDTVPNPVSVRYFLIHLGRNSGVIQEIRKVIIDSKWANAWLRLRATGISWYEIIDIYYSRR